MTVDTSGLTKEQARLAVLSVADEANARRLAARAMRVRALAEAATGEANRAARKADDSRRALAWAVPDWQERMMEGGS